MSNFLPHGTSILPVIGQVHSVIKQPDGKLVLVGGRGVVRLNTDGSLDTRFGTNGIASVSEYIGHDIYSNNYLGVQADGKLVLVGHSANANDYGMVRLNDNGSLDSSFGTNGTLTLAIGDGEDRAKSVVIQPDGKLVVAGFSQDDNGSGHYSIARLNADGSLDTSFATNGKLMLNNVYGEVQNIIVQPDSKLLLVGSEGLVRLNANGSLDSSFGNNGVSSSGGYGNTVLQSDGKLLRATNSGVVRFNADGFLDRSFGDDGFVRNFSGITNLAIQPDGKVMLVGSSGGLKSDYIAVRLNANGSVDSGFGTNGTLTFDISGQDSATSLVILPDGKVVLVGSSQGVDFTNYSVARLNADGSLDTSFANALPIVANTAVAGIKTDTLLTGAVVATDANGDALSYRLLRAAPAGLIFNNDGTFSFTPSQADQQLNDGQSRVVNVEYVVNDGLADSLSARLSITINGVGNTPRGKLILPVGSGHDHAHSVIQQADGKLVVAGYSVNGTDNDYSVVRLNSDGTLDTSFANGGKLILSVGVGYDEAKSLITQADGKIVLAGYSRNGASYDYSAVRLNSNGSIDTSFGVNGKLILPVGDGYDEVKSMIMQPDGKWVLVGISFNGSNNDYSAVRLNNDGSIDTSFGVNGKLILPVGNGDDAAQTAVIQPDGKLVLAGYSSNGTNNDYSVLRLNSNGSVDTSFGINGKLLLPVGSSEDYAYSVAIQSDGKLVLAGRSVNGNNSDYSVVRLNANGTLDTSFANGGILMLPVGNYWDEVRSVMLQTDGKVVLTGRSHNTSSYYDDDFSAVRLNSDGSLDASFGIGGKLIISVGKSSDTASSAIIQTDGKLVLVGGSDNLDNNEDYGIVRLNSDGSLDGTFANQAPVAASKAVFGSEDDRPITGSVQATDANNDALSYRLAATAPVGLTFNSNGSFSFTPSDADQFLNDGQSRIVNFSYIANDGQADSAPANVTLTINGVTEGKLIVPVGGFDLAQSVIVQPDGKLVIAGTTDGDYSIVRLNSDGTLDTSFSDDGKLVLPVGNSNDTAYSVAIQADGKLVLAGVSLDANTDNNNYYSYSYSYSYSIVRLNRDGSLDTSFSGDGKLVLSLGNGSPNYHYDLAYSVAIQSDGKLVLAGRSGGDYGIVRLNSDGTLDTSFGVGGKQSIDNGSDDVAYSVTIQADGKLVLAGSSGSDFGIVRLNSDGTLDASFGVGGKQSIDVANGYDTAYSIAIQPDGKLVLAGSSRDANTNKSSFSMVRLNSDGSLDASFGIDGQLMVPSGVSYDPDTSVMIQPDGKLVLAGVTSTLIVTTTGNSTTSYYNYSYSIMRFNSDGSFDSSFGAGGRLLLPVSNAHPALSAALQADGKLVLTGTSNQNNNYDYVVMRINADGSLDSGFGNSGVALEVPIASNIAITGTEDDSVITGAVLATDVNGDPLSYSLVGESPAGLTFNSNGSLSFVPSAADQLLNDGQSRVVMFDYVANDGQANSAPATITITINGITDAGMAAGVDGGQTVIERNPDGTTTYTHNNGGNGSDWQQTFNSQGYLVTQVDNDQNHTELWVNRTATLNSTGQLLQVEMTNDDNSRDVLTLDANNSQVWKQQNRHYDMTGNLDYIVTTNDDGSTDWQDQDNSNNHTWTTINSHQTATGTLDWYRYINDDGTQDWLDLDQDNSQAWTEQAANKNAFGQDVQRTVIFDDNTRDVTLLDVNNVKVWQQNTQHFNANGVYQGSDVLLDAGIAANQVWLRQIGSNLEVSQMGTNNKILIADWFINSPASQKTNFQLASVGTLLATEVQALVTAMASFSPPLDSQTSLTMAQHQALDSVIAANWS